MTWKVEIVCSSLFFVYRKRIIRFSTFPFFFISIVSRKPNNSFLFMNFEVFVTGVFLFFCFNSSRREQISIFYVRLYINLIEYLYCNREKEQEASVREGTRLTPSASGAVAAAFTCKRADAPPAVFPQPASENVSGFIAALYC